MKIERVNINDCDPDEYIYIGRPSKYGNLYTSKQSKIAEIVPTRKEAIEKFDEYVTDNPDIVDELIFEMNEKQIFKIGCWCKTGQSCHGDIYIKHIKYRNMKSLF